METPLSATFTRDIICVLALAFCFPLLRWILNRIAFRPLASALLTPRTPLRDEHSRKQLEGKIIKLTESNWKFFCYGTMLLLGTFSTASQPWFLDSKHYWIGWPNQPITTSMRVLYYAELAYYASSILMLALWEIPRKDQGVMMLHHWATVVLIAFSHAYNYHRSASAIMFLHDVNDVLMEAAKSFNYLDMDAAATAVFAVFMVSWAVSRITLYPLVVIRSAIFESKQVLGFAPPAYTLINCGLVLLYCINLYWFGLILRIAWAKITTGEGHDIREDEDEGGDSEGENSGPSRPHQE